ncbi:hypothetical protein CHL78_017815 [Romboutsia weinsteinii]|uniref:B3/B4 tRNA-binding domain-containing protein n=1 Tax=Romboutsia weinsteinii TaxID=2020949 RepID=A0A371IYH7_9FIRM|nr:phenylalanine--tRNA ligase beta subunit-related protein [Romboutsia weinsteinii]RDY25524.1 hypothetical protein CHL78_017815 [Romboutsia weinsteinii]
MKLYIGSKLRDKCPKTCIGSIEAKVKVSDSSEELLNIMNDMCREIEDTIDTKSISKIKNISDSRSSYRSVGKDPTRYRLSSEALIRRVAKGDGLYKVNNVVDINNIVSLDSVYSVGTYDLEKLRGDVKFTVGDSGESYTGIGKGDINIENLPVFEDEEGKFGSTTSDSTRAMITTSSTHILMNIISFNGDEELEYYMNVAEELLVKYADGEILNKNIIK